MDSCSNLGVTLLVLDNEWFEVVRVAGIGER